MDQLQQSNDHCEIYCPKWITPFHQFDLTHCCICWPNILEILWQIHGPTIPNLCPNALHAFAVCFAFKALAICFTIAPPIICTTISVAISSSSNWMAIIRQTVEIASRYSGRDCLVIEIADKNQTIDFPNCKTRASEEMLNLLRDIPGILEITLLEQVPA